MVQKNTVSEKDCYDINDLLEIMHILRSPGGCPWDGEQTHSSIRNNLLEEAYEAADAIDNRDMQALKEELGDVLLQVVFHCEMASENSSFNFNQVADGICRKLILRHPHIFGDVKVSGTNEVLENWDKIKRREKSQETYTDTLQSVPKSFPALMRAQKVQKRAAKAGFDWEDTAGALQKLYEEMQELKIAIDSGVQDDIKEELGDLLFSVVNVARFSNVDAEQALQNATEKFIKRFKLVEQTAIKRGIDIDKASLAELDAIWDEIKHQQ
ncbi:MAG TPA: nucleoside triphosphate pyrophosphohydrolase [Clostridiales bacterium]|nr:nucleoside triphosphate pyrophosphohydrolase [Clostridiales bacterium]